MEVHTEIQIEASLDQVWRILTHFESYPEWNPFITRLQGELRPGAVLIAEVSGSQASPTVLRVEPCREIRLWNRFMSGLDGEHILAMETTSEGKVRLVHDFYYRGQLVKNYAAKLGKNSRRDAEGMNRALRPAPSIGTMEVSDPSSDILGRVQSCGSSHLGRNGLGLDSQLSVLWA